MVHHRTNSDVHLDPRFERSQDYRYMLGCILLAAMHCVPSGAHHQWAQQGGTRQRVR